MSSSWNAAGAQVGPAGPKSVMTQLRRLSPLAFNYLLSLEVGATVGYLDPEATLASPPVAAAS